MEQKTKSTELSLSGKIRQSIGYALGIREKPVQEKSATGGYPMSLSGGWIPSNWNWNWWQEGKDPIMSGGSVTVQACTDAYAHTIATLVAFHYSLDDNFTRTPIFTSALSRILHRPNSYQTLSDFMLNLVKSILLQGNGYVYCTRNDRNEIDSIHLLPASTRPYIDQETQSIFYAAGTNPVLGDIQAMIPQRDIMHIRLYCPDNPLVGVTPVEYAAMSIAANSAITSHEANFFRNMSRPSGVLSTDMKLTREQMVSLRGAWEDQAKMLDSGGIPILSSGIKWEPMALSAIDAQIVDAFNMTVNDIARAFRVPLPLIQLHNEASTYNNVEQLYAQWLSGGLGFLIEHIEQNFSYFFKLKRNEGTEFDTETLLRTDFKGKVEGYSKGVQGGLFSPNEARKRGFNLKPLPHGDTAYMQQQMVPLGWQPADEPESDPVDDPPDEGADEVDEDTKAQLAEIFLRKEMET